MAAAFTITDNADGTVTWTLTGTTGDAWTAYTATWSNIGTGAWTSNATGTGDSSENGNLSAGFYFGYVVTDSVSIVPKYFRATDGADAVQMQILDAVQSRIVGLTLTDIEDDSIVVRKQPWDRNILKPAVIVSPVPENRDHLAGNNAFDETAYGCLITVWQSSNQDLTSDLNRHLQWRQDITRAFENQQAISAVSEVTHCRIDPVSVEIPHEFVRGYDVQTLIVRAHALEGRL